MTSINMIVNQLLFFSMCDIALYGYEQITALVGLNSLLLYYVITYFVQRVHDITSNMKSSATNQKSSSSLLLCIFKIILEWSKAVIVIICLKEQGLKAHPYVLYSTITFLYYVLTESIYNNMFLTLLNSLQCKYFEGLEDLYGPIILQLLRIYFSIILLPSVLLYKRNFGFICLYHNVFLQIKLFYNSYWLRLQQERNIFEKFPLASKEEIETLNDVCAICINNMTHARKTCCGHLFHADCLRRCIKTSEHCPLCKTIVNN